MLSAALRSLSTVTAAYTVRSNKSKHSEIYSVVLYCYCKQTMTQISTKVHCTLVFLSIWRSTLFVRMRNWRCNAIVVSPLRIDSNFLSRSRLIRSASLCITQLQNIRQHTFCEAAKDWQCHLVNRKTEQWYYKSTRLKVTEIHLKFNKWLQYCSNGCIVVPSGKWRRTKLSPAWQTDWQMPRLWDHQSQ